MCALECQGCSSGQRQRWAVASSLPGPAQPAHLKSLVVLVARCLFCSVKHTVEDEGVAGRVAQLGLGGVEEALGEVLTAIRWVNSNEASSGEVGVSAFMCYMSHAHVCLRWC
jgi:hypothetical protein